MLIQNFFDGVGHSMELDLAPSKHYFNSLKFSMLSSHADHFQKTPWGTSSIVHQIIEQDVIDMTIKMVGTCPAMREHRMYLLPKPDPAVSSISSRSMASRLLWTKWDQSMESLGCRQHWSQSLFLLHFTSLSCLLDQCCICRTICTIQFLVCRTADGHCSPRPGGLQ